jgi:hypothetical protein
MKKAKKRKKPADKNALTSEQLRDVKAWCRPGLSASEANSCHDDSCPGGCLEFWLAVEEWIEAMSDRELLELADELGTAESATNIDYFPKLEISVYGPFARRTVLFERETRRNMKELLEQMERLAAKQQHILSR